MPLKNTRIHSLKRNSFSTRRNGIPNCNQSNATANVHRMEHPHPPRSFRKSYAAIPGAPFLQRRPIGCPKRRHCTNCHNRDIRVPPTNRECRIPFAYRLRRLRPCFRGNRCSPICTQHILRCNGLSSHCHLHVQFFRHFQSKRFCIFVGDHRGQFYGQFHEFIPFRRIEPHVWTFRFQHRLPNIGHGCFRTRPIFWIQHRTCRDGVCVDP
jgi:hypothetical protein